MKTMIMIFFALLTTIFTTTSADDSDENSIGRSLNPAHVLSSLASNFMSRGYIPTGIGGGSQLVTFNVQNLFYLLLLKVLIYAAATVGAGHHFKDGFARTAEDVNEKFITDDEVLMFLSFLSGSPNCLQNIACQQPYQAKKYVSAGDLLLKAARMFSYNPDINYDEILKDMDRAANVGLTGGNCTKFKCSIKQT